MSYRPDIHTSTNKPIAAWESPDSAIYLYYDQSTFSYRPYSSVSEALNYLSTPESRGGHITVLVGEVEYWFRDGVSDEDLIEKASRLNKIKIPLNEDVIINWQSVEPSTGKTYAQLLGNEISWSAYYSISGNEVSYQPTIVIKRSSGNITQVQITDVSPGYIIFI